MKEGTRKFLTSALLLLLASSVVVAPLFVVENVNAEDGGSWTTLAPLPTRTGSYTGTTALNDKIYFIESKRNMCYDPETNSWTNGTSIPTAVYGAGACVITGPSASKRIHVIGGQLNYFYRYIGIGLDLNQIYDPETDTWTTDTPMPTSRTELGIAVINDEIYAIGGRTREVGYLTENENYSPTDPIPEFPSWIILPLFVVAILVVTVARSKFLGKRLE